ncbi:iron-siderophore ABC transporter substrate-binding protein [Georgenia yuyongxinii]|uniref:Iron-siderophore ABC transporter substrate-binding protein n=1 Tax=Georgenia yuyongxinii TaxID=2589797 RepID=A0A5B8C2K4_9MICO|nr:iron-siderophore ABC transporter substrate-binding protein [Georgenia yuyongxinii]QDC24367.1 iron-siderophore ABC transporter substrate-binding protein [Georgenia yuyongxinii]
MTLSRPVAAVATAAAALLALAACSSGGSAEEAPASASAAGEPAPVTIQHAFGSTTIPEQPENVVTLGWGSTEAALALGVVPVGIESQTYAADENGQLPWVAEALTDAGAEPTMLPATVEEPAYEEIGALAPDVILAPYSGITAEQYELLSEIAPTVAYPEEPWTTPWRDVITTVGTALGVPDKADTLVGDLDAQITEAAQAHPELAGKTVAAVWDLSGTFYVYKAQDSRVDFLLDLGLVSAPAVDELATDEESFVYTLSTEETDRLDSDILVNYASTQEEVDTFLGKSYAQAIPAVQAGAVANITGDQLIAAMSPPTALSIDWGLDTYVDLISKAAAAVK